MSAVDDLITEHIDIWTSAVKRKSSSGRGGGKKVDLYGVKKLRELILDLAVRGLLVPQNPEDEPARVLLERIGAEKTQLVKEKKIKKQNAFSEIVDSQAPYELPPSWSWSCLGNLTSDIHYGYTASATNELSGIRLLRITDIQNDRVNWKTVPGCEIESDKLPKYQLEDDDILIARTGGTIGKSYLVENITVEAVFASYLIRVRRISAMYAAYIKKFLGSGIYWRQLYEFSAGTGQPNVNATALKSLFVPIPPILEQHRIAAKVDELMALCDQLEQQTEASLTAHQTLVQTLLDALTRAAASQPNNLQSATDAPTPFEQAWNRLAKHFDTVFTTEESIEQLKQTILQLAVMGKLVPQDPNDEPASVLLERIAAEKAALVKAKKIRKLKVLPEIGEAEKLFDLPNGWEWNRLESLVEIYSGITKGRKLAGRETITVPYLSVANVQRSFLDLDYIKETDIPVEEEEKYQVRAGDLLITEGGDWDKVGRTAIWRETGKYVAHQNHVFKARKYLQEQNELWIEKYLNSPFSRDYFAGSSKQTTNLASINKTQLRGCLIACPPLNEQCRIVTKLEELMHHCDELKTQLIDAQTTERRIANAAIERAVG